MSLLLLLFEFREGKSLSFITCTKEVRLDPPSFLSSGPFFRRFFFGSEKPFSRPRCVLCRGTTGERYVTISLNTCGVFGPAKTDGESPLNAPTATWPIPKTIGGRESGLKNCIYVRSFRGRTSRSNGVKIEGLKSSMVQKKNTTTSFEVRTPNGAKEVSSHGIRCFSCLPILLLYGR